jgi:hypothetical protein
MGDGKRSFVDAQPASPHPMLGSVENSRRESTTSIPAGPVFSTPCSSDTHAFRRPSRTPSTRSTRSSAPAWPPSTSMSIAPAAPRPAGRAAAPNHHRAPRGSAREHAQRQGTNDRPAHDRRRDPHRALRPTPSQLRARTRTRRPAHLGAALVTFNLRIDDIHPAQPVTFKLRPTFRPAKYENVGRMTAEPSHRSERLVAKDGILDWRYRVHRAATSRSTGRFRVASAPRSEH